MHSKKDYKIILQYNTLEIDSIIFVEDKRIHHIDMRHPSDVTFIMLPVDKVHLLYINTYPIVLSHTKINIHIYYM